MGGLKILMFMVFLGSLLLISCTEASPPATSQSNLPMLTVPGEVVITPPDPAVGEKVFVLFFITNQGGAVASPVRYQYNQQAAGLSKSESVVVSGDLGPCTDSTVLQPGQSCAWAYVFTFTTPGTKKMEVELLNPPNERGGRATSNTIVRFKIEVGPANYSN